MRILDGDNQTPLFQAQLYLTPDEARAFIHALNALLRDPDSNQHEHIFSGDGRRDISISLITPSKLNELHRYSAAEQAMFREP